MDPVEQSNRLGPVLQYWKVNAALPPRFHDEVWRRIQLTEARRVAGWRGLLDVVEGAFGRPALAISYVAILVLAGLSIGFTQARQASERIDRALGVRYVRSVDPYQAPRH